MNRIPSASRGALTVVAVLFHALGILLVFRRRLGRQTMRLNAAAVFVTLVAMTVVYVMTSRVAAVFLTWAICHFAWGAWLAALVLQGREDR